MGSQPPSVYWRRRIVLVGALVLLLVLIVLTVKAVVGGDNSTPVADSSSSGSTTPPPSTSQPSTKASTAKSSAKSSAKPSSKAPTSSKASTATPVACKPASLAIQAVVGAASYKVGAKPVLELQVTNTGTVPCVQDLADPQIELKVYNGASRVWGSHDCKISPGTDDRTLAVNMPVRVTLTWTGTTSQPKCAGTRQQVGAGTYTLYAALAGRTGKAAQFSIT